MAPYQNEQELRSLFSQWLEGNGDAGTVKRLSELAENPELASVWKSLLAAVPEEAQPGHDAILEQVYQNLLAELPELQVTAPVRRMKPWMKYAAAAALLLVAGGGYYFYSSTKEEAGREQLSNITPAERPTSNNNKNKAILTLGNGKQIVLDASGNGQLAQQTGSLVIKPADGQIVYNSNDSIPSQRAVEFNTVTTPRGGEYKVKLPDGTDVWLNAASSITFPTNFNDADRTVSVQGEVYLEVKKNTAKPFRVKVKDATIEVLGTSFNVNAYNDEPVTRITLLEGSIHVTKGNEQKMLKPGQQLWFRATGNVLTLADDVDTEQVMAWKNGVFDFRNQDIGLVMNQLGRWYNMDIMYEGKRPDVKILGMMGRNTDLKTLLNSLELTSGIRFSLEYSPAKNEAGKIIVH